MTAAVWADCVAWSDADTECQVDHDQTGRPWDVLFMAHHAVHSSPSGGDRVAFQLYRVPRDGRSTQAGITTLTLLAGPGDQGEPVITILLPDED